MNSIRCRLLVRLPVAINLVVLNRRIAAFLALLLFILFTASPIQASWEKVTLPLSRAETVALSIAPSNSSRLYMGLFGLGVYRTDDRGTTWTPAAGGLPPGASVWAIDVSPFNADHAWAGIATVWRTTNAGVSWTTGTGIPPSGSISDILVHATNPSILHTIYYPSWQLFRSTDAGSTWTEAGTSLNVDFYELEARSSNPDVILASTAGGVARSTDAGVTWTPGAGLVLKNIEMAESDASRVYARKDDVPRDIFYRSTDGGISFSSLGHVPSVAASGDIFLLAAHPTNANVIAAALANVGIVNIPGFNPEITSSTNGGVTWSGGGIHYFDDILGVPTALLFDPTNAAHVYFGMYATIESGFLHSSNGGADWSIQVQGIDNYTLNALRGTASGSNIAGVGDKLYRSPSDLDVWQTLDGWSYHGDGVFEVSETPGLMWSAGSVIVGDIGQDLVIRSTDFGNSWWPEGILPPGLGTPGVGFEPSPVVANHGDGSTAYISGYGGAYRSTNQGDSWEQVNAMQFLDGVVDPSDANRLFVTGYYDPPVQLSTDGGATFTPRSNGLPAGTFLNYVQWIFMRRADPDYLEVVYTNGQIWETFDAGISWTLRFSLDMQGAWINDVTWDEATGHVFAAINGSMDVPAVVSTHPLFDPSGLPASWATVVHWDAAKSTLLAGVNLAGLWQQSIASPVDAPVVASAAALDLRISPNPSSSVSAVRFEVPRDGAAVRAEVFDATGRRVRRLVDASLPGGARELFWDGRTDGGQNTSAGVYFVKVRVANTEASARIVRVP